MSYSYTRLSDITLVSLKNSMSSNRKWSELDSDEMMSFINEGIIGVGKKRNSLDKKTYRVDMVADADLVLSPSAAGNEASFEDFLEIMVSAYTGDASVVTANTDTNVGGLTFDESPTVDVSGALAVYTIKITGSTFADGRLYFETPYPGLVSFELVNATTFKIHAQKSHGAFSVTLKKRKLT